MFSLENMRNPQRVAHIDLGERPSAKIHVVEPYLFVIKEVQDNFYLNIFDVSNPLSAKELYEVEFNDETRDIYADENYAYILFRNSLRIYDISDIENPQQISEYQGLNNSYRFRLHDDKLYVNDQPYIKVIDISDRENPELVDRFYADNVVNSTATDDNIFVAALSNDMFILDLTGTWGVDEPNVQLLPETMILYPTFPNPFNSVTKVSYSLPAATDITLELFSILGQRVQTLFKGLEQAGTHFTTLTGSIIPSGLYFVRLKAPDQIFIQKVILIK